MAAFKIPATPETQHLLDAQRERSAQRREQETDEASQASTASTADISDEDEDGNDAASEDNECIDFDTIETYTANVQNKKRIFADEILRV